jgi:hypothetical protein
MPVDDRRRLALHDAVRRTLGEDEASTLMELLPPIGWADIATKHDLAALEQRLLGRIDRLEGRIEGLEGRVDGLEGRIDGLEGRIAGLAAEMRAGFDRRANRILMWLVPVVLASTAISTTVAARL